MPTNKKRKPGFYWVKINGGWTVGVFKELWYLPGVSSVFWDNEFDEIGERPLRQPVYTTTLSGKEGGEG